MGGFINITTDPTAKLIGSVRPLWLGDTWLHSRAGVPVDRLAFVVGHCQEQKSAFCSSDLRLSFLYLSFRKNGNSLLTHYFLNETAPVISFAAEYCRTQCFLDKFFLEKQSSFKYGV